MLFIKPKLDPAYRASMLEKQDLLKEAVIEYKRVLEDKPNDFITHYRLGNIYLKLDELDLALLHFEEILVIDKYNFEVEKHEIQKKLANLYYLRDDPAKTFQMYLEILNSFPSDEEALYQVAFIALSQEEFDLAQKYFERLVKLNKEDFTILFGAGICSLQIMKITDAIEYFTSAIELKSTSEAAHLALAFSLYLKRDYKEAIPHINSVIQASSDPEITFISKRLLAFIYLQFKREEEGIKILEEILDIAKSNSMEEEALLTTFDLGFASIKAGKNNKTYEIWNELYRQEKNYKNLQNLIMLLRKDIDKDNKTPKDDFEESITDRMDSWLEEAFPKDFVWNICGLKSNKKIDIKNIMVTTRISVSKDADSDSKKAASEYMDKINEFCNLETEKFRIAANRVVRKIGYKVDQILQTYRDSDGVDFLAYSLEDKNKTLVWVRRWTKNAVGEITLRNFAQAINDTKAVQGLFVTTSDLTDAAKNSLSRLSKVMVIYPDQLNEFLRGIL